MSKNLVHMNIYTHCSVCDATPLQLLHEHLDPIDHVIVGELVCPRCGRQYVDCRRAGDVRPNSPRDVGLERAISDSIDPQHPPVALKGRPMRTRKAKQPKPPKKVSYELITDRTHRIYEMLETLIAEFHTDLLQARIGIAWCDAWKPDVDGRLILGKCKKASDLDRELAEFDFIVLINRGFWFDFMTDDGKRRALLDHELCHAAVKLDDTSGEPERDARDRVVYRTRKHDIEEFGQIVDRHGCYKRDLEAFAKAIEKARQRAGAGWIGYTAVRDALLTAGVDVQVETVTQWTDSQRHDAMIWALVQSAATLDAAPPAHVAKFVPSTTSASRSAEAHA